MPDELDALVESANMEEISNEICGEGTKWNIVRREHAHFPSKDLHQNMKVWHHFICSRLVPTLDTSEVMKDRALLLYGIKKGPGDQCLGLDPFQHSPYHPIRLWRYPTSYTADRVDRIPWHCHHRSGGPTT